MDNDMHIEKYPHIVLDDRRNSVNGNNMPARISNEEWEDILHHTHNIEDIIGYDEIGGGGGSTDANTIKRVKALEETVKQQQTEIEELRQKNEEIMEILKSYNMIDISTGKEIL